MASIYKRTAKKSVEIVSVYKEETSCINEKAKKIDFVIAKARKADLLMLWQK
jgi:hypothetical protein